MNKKKLVRAIRKVVPVAGGAASGVGAAAGTMAGISTWGVAGTGIAISELSGAAAASATLAAVGGPLVLVAGGLVVAGGAWYGLHRWLG